jgi:RNA recognition motif-containing protein
MPEARAMVGI